MATLLHLQKQREEALAAVARANTEATRTDAMKRLDSVTLAVARAEARIDSKTKVWSKKEERYEEEEEDSEEEKGEDSEEEEEEEEEKSARKDDEPKKPLMKKGAKADDSEEEEEEEKAEDDSEEEGDSDDSDDDDNGDNGDDSDSDSDTDEEEEARAMLAAKSGLYTHDRLWRLAKQVTGKASVQAVFGALDAMGLRLKGVEDLEKRLAKIEDKARAQSVDKMLSRACAEGKVTPAAVPSLRAKGMGDPKWLRGHLDTLPARVRTTGDGAREGRSYAGDVDVHAEADDAAARASGKKARAVVLDAQNMPPEQRRAIEAMAMDSGLGFDEFVAKMNQTSRDRANGVRPSTPKAK